MTESQKMYVRELLAKHAAGNAYAASELESFIDGLCEGAVVAFAMAASVADDVEAHITNTLYQYEAFGLDRGSELTVGNCLRCGRRVGRSVNNGGCGCTRPPLLG